MNDRRNWPHGVGIVPDIGRELAIGGARAVQLRHRAQVCGSRWVAPGQHHGTPKYTIPDGCPSATRELAPALRRGKFTTENRLNNKHHKMYRQFSKPPGQFPGEYSREYPRATSVEGDDRRYRGLKIPMGDSLFAAYDPLDIKNAKYLSG